MIIRFENISKIYPPSTIALKDVSFDIEENEFISFVGKSGAGKTTLIKMLLREEMPTKGNIYFENCNVCKVKSGQLFYYRQQIGAIFQDYKLLNHKTVYENVSYAMEVMGATDTEIKRDIPLLLNIVGLDDKANHFPKELSGGEKQRAAIARALATRPKVIVADEPTGNLDPYHTKDIINLLKKIHELGNTIILSTHNKAVINSLKKRVITLDRGEVIRDEKIGRFIL